MRYNFYVNRSNVRIDLETHLDGRSLYWLAKMTGLPYSTIHKIANNKTDGISFIVLEKLCAVFDCEPCELIVKDKVKQQNSLSHI